MPNMTFESQYNSTPKIEEWAQAAYVHEAQSAIIAFGKLLINVARASFDSGH